MKWRNLILILWVALVVAACTPPKPPCCEDVGLDLHPINPEMMTQEQVKAARNS